MEPKSVNGPLALSANADSRSAPAVRQLVQLAWGLVAPWLSGLLATVALFCWVTIVGLFFFFTIIIHHEA